MPLPNPRSRLRKGLKLAMEICLAAVLIFSAFLYIALRLPLGADPSGARLKRMQASPHYRNGHFVNTLLTVMMRPGTLRESLRLWLGHATFLIELDNAVLLTDPVLSERASPLAWIGPKRFHPVPLASADFPQLDAVVISHDHYDHLDYASIQALLPKTRKFFVPLGIGAHLEK